MSPTSITAALWKEATHVAVHLRAYTAFAFKILEIKAGKVRLNTYWTYPTFVSRMIQEIKDKILNTFGFHNFKDLSFKIKALNISYQPHNLIAQFHGV